MVAEPLKKQNNCGVASCRHKHDGYIYSESPGAENHAINRVVRSVSAAAEGFARWCQTAAGDKKRPKHREIRKTVDKSATQRAEPAPLLRSYSMLPPSKLLPSRHTVGAKQNDRSGAWRTRRDQVWAESRGLWLGQHRLSPAPRRRFRTLCGGSRTLFSQGLRASFPSFSATFFYILRAILFHDGSQGIYLDFEDFGCEIFRILLDCKCLSWFTSIRLLTTIGQFFSTDLFFGFSAIPPLTVQFPDDLFYVHNSRVNTYSTTCLFVLLWKNSEQVTVSWCHSDYNV